MAWHRLPPRRGCSQSWYLCCSAVCGVGDWAGTASRRQLPSTVLLMAAAAHRFRGLPRLLLTQAAGKMARHSCHSALGQYPERCSSLLQLRRMDQWLRCASVSSTRSLCSLLAMCVLTVCSFKDDAFVMPYLKSGFTGPPRTMVGTMQGVES